MDTQLIAHDKEVYDIAWGGWGVFATVAADGSVRVFDLRDKQHSSIIYECPVPNTPLLRLSWNKQVGAAAGGGVHAARAPKLPCRKHGLLTCVAPCPTPPPHHPAPPPLPAGPALHGHRHHGLIQGRGAGHQVGLGRGLGLAGPERPAAHAHARVRSLCGGGSGARPVRQAASAAVQQLQSQARIAPPPLSPPCRYPSLPITELTRHQAPVNGVAWAPHSSAHVCTAGDDSQVCTHGSVCGKAANLQHCVQGAWACIAAGTI